MTMCERVRDMDAGVVMSGSDAPSQRLQTVLLVSEGIREAQLSALVYCKCPEGFHTLSRRHLQTINMSHRESDTEHQWEELSGSQGALLDAVNVEILSDNPMARSATFCYFTRNSAPEHLEERKNSIQRG